MAIRKTSRDNLSGIQASGLRLIILIPGMIIQWLLYMGVANKSYSEVRQNTRLARSPIMTWIFSIGFWFLIVLLLIAGWLKPSSPTTLDTTAVETTESHKEAARITPDETQDTSH